MRPSICAAAVLAALTTTGPACRGQAAPPSPRPLPTIAAGATPRPSTAGSVLSGTPLYSQHKEELIVRDFFGDRRGGVFLDVGCASPIQDSNTYYLEKHLGWSGIAIDALPEFAQPWLRKRPRSRFFNFFVSDHADTTEPFYRSALRGTSSGRKDQKG